MRSFAYAEPVNAVEPNGSGPAEIASISGRSEVVMDSIWSELKALDELYAQNAILHKAISKLDFQDKQSLQF